MLAQSGAYGMEKTVDPAHEIGESLTITERSQLLSITPEQRKKIKSLRIENQIFKENLTLTFAFSGNDVEQIYFDSCSFQGKGLWALRNFPDATRIGFTRCGLSCYTLKELLDACNPYQSLELLDLSGNNFEDPILFIEVLKRTIFCFKSLPRLIISNSGFDPTNVPLFQPYIGEVIL